MLTLLVSVLLSLGEHEAWNNCLYNNKSIACRRQFLCTQAPCGTFRLEWIDGLSDVFTLQRPGVAKNVGYYTDSRGGEWILRGYAGSFALKNLQNHNTIIFAMTLSQCRLSGLSDLCE
ncbi:hypothetical protein [Synechococcus sp. NOUM97013]|uniref:hypothetical protein n=1 Tax=Synechococcus sp. NOUM97013 TaxID=1442555 RepID=UPI001644C411|nr:hypothetical protein [Synechococcus sp. NOUM97013]